MLIQLRGCYLSRLHRLSTNVDGDLTAVSSESFIGQAPMPTPQEKLLIVGLRDARPLA